MQTVQFTGILKFMMENSGVISITNMKLLSVYEDKEIGFWIKVFAFIWMFTLVIRWLMGL